VGDIPKMGLLGGGAKGKVHGWGTFPGRGPKSKVHGWGTFPGRGPKSKALGQGERKGVRYILEIRALLGQGGTLP